MELGLIGGALLANILYLIYVRYTARKLEGDWLKWADRHERQVAQAFCCPSCGWASFQPRIRSATDGMRAERMRDKIKQKVPRPRSSV